MQRRSSRNRLKQETAAMKNENNEEMTQEEFEKKAKEIGKDISDYFVHVITHIKYDENNVPYADTELKEYMKKGQEKAKERAKYFENKEFSKIIEDFVYQQLNDVTEYAFNHAEELRKSKESSPEAERLNQLVLKGDQFYPFYASDFANEIAHYNEKSANINPYEDYAEIKADQGTLKIIDYSTLKGKKLNTLSKKLLDICILNVSQTLVHGSTTPNNRYVSLTVEELAELMNQPLETSKQREKFIERVYDGMKQLRHLSWRQSNENKIKKISDLNYVEIMLFECTGKDKNAFKFVFTPSAARILACSPVCESFPTNLFKLDNRYGNAYEIGRKMIRHTNINSNRSIGTENTLSVNKLIENSEIPTFKEVIEIQKRRDWKEQIKKPFENSLNHLKNVNVLSRWEYRTPSGESLTPEQADKLNALEFQSLVVDFAVSYSEEEQSKRLKTDKKLIEKKKKSNETNG